MIDRNLIKKAEAAASTEELIVIAKEAGIELTKEQVTKVFEKLHRADGELADEELANASGGSKCLTGDNCRYFIARDSDYTGRVDCKKCHWESHGWCTWTC
jgi:predicted ribosomally synthesized peptide with nif11-like leader